MTCSQCGAPLEAGAVECKYCGSAVEKAAPEPVYVNPAQMPIMPYQPPTFAQNPGFYDGINPSWPIKSKTTAGLLAIFFGALGIHKFYLGKTVQGVICLLLTTTAVFAVPMWFLGIANGIEYLVQSEHNFQVKNQVRTR